MEDKRKSCIHHAEEGEAWLAKAQELASLILVDGGLVKAFKGRWIVINNRSQQLLMSLATLYNFECLGNPQIRDLLSNIVDTLEEGRSLASRCTDLEYGGKLLMQSHLDAFATKLDLYLRDLELLVKSGVLRETADLTISCKELPSPDAKREVGTLHVWDLFARLKIGNSEFKKSALESLIEYLKQDNDRVVLVAEEGDIPYLIHLLDSGLPIIREKAVDAVSILAQSDFCRQSLTIENAHAPLIRLLETGTPVAKEKAAEALRGITYSRESAYAVAALGGIASLVDICKKGTPAAQAMAAGTLRNLAANEEIRRRLAEENAIPILINLVTSGTLLAQEFAAEALQNLAAGDERFKLVIARQGGLQCLMRYLNRVASSKGQEAAIKALRNLADSAVNAKALVSAGYLSQLAIILNTGTSTVQELAATAICHLSCSLDVRKALGEAGCIPPLTRMLEAKNSTQQETAAQALSSLLLHNSNRKEFYKEEKGISHLVQMLDPRNQNISKSFPISALLALSASNNCRKRILSAGARQHLEKLAEMDVAGAKKTLDKIGGNRLRNIFHRYIS